MQWEKKGLIFAPSADHPFCKTRIMCPAPILTHEENLRIYAAMCDDKGIARIGYIDVDPLNPSRILDVSQRPVLDLGEDGMFDDNGISCPYVIRQGNLWWMYYVAFQQGVKIPYYMFTGLAQSRDGKWFDRMLKVPVLDRSDAEPIMRSGATVMYDADVRKFKCWYSTGNRFIEVNGKPVHSYVFKYLESDDGIHWPGEGTVCLPHANDDEFGFARPYIFKNAPDDYEMFYSIRTKSKLYRLGYATSKDGIHWDRRDDEIGIDVSAEGWDSEMLCYSSVYKGADKTYLFYNGNGLGNTGFGYAELMK